MPDRYDVRITFDAEEGGDEVADWLVRTFSAPRTATAARPSGVRAEDDRVTVTFDELSPIEPAHGTEYRPPVPDEPSEAPGQRAIHELEPMSADALIPIVRALVALVGARTRAGLTPRQRLTLEIAPSPIHGQEELRHEG